MKYKHFMGGALSPYETVFADISFERYMKMIGE